MSEYRFVYPSTLEAEGRLLDDCTRTLNDCAVESALVHRFLQAVSEAFTNALEHGNKMDSTKQITVILTVNETEIVADIIDEGKGGLSAIREKRPPELLAEGGRGVDLIRLYTDEAHFSENEAGGLKVTMRVARQSKQYIKK